MKARTIMTVVALAFVSLGQVALAHEITGKEMIGAQPVPGRKAMRGTNTIGLDAFC
ncbi:MAG: hypothetical protein WBP34_04330 [Thermoanaerobaculia bacterium]